MSILKKIVLPTLVFFSFSCAAVYIVLRQSLVQSGLDFKITAICGPSTIPHPYRLTYINIPSADKFICGLVVFFQTLVDPAYQLKPLLATIFPADGVLALIAYLEAARNRPPFALRLPTLFFALSQVATMAVIMPIFFMLFILTGNASLQPSITPTLTPPSNINQGNAEALLFGLLLGYVLPTTLMVYLGNPYMTAIWQGFPFIFALAVFAHKLIRPPSRLVHSGHPTVLVTLVFALVSSALLHAVYIWPVLTDGVAFWTMFMPNLGIPHPTDMPLADGVVQFIKWDLILGFVSAMLATLWMADSVLGLVGILAWYSLATIAIGPAAAIAGVFLWRERRLNGQRRTQRKVE